MRVNKKKKTAKGAKKQNGATTSNVVSPGITKKRGRPNNASLKEKRTQKPKRFRKDLSGFLLAFGEGDQGQLGIEVPGTKRKPAVTGLSDEAVDQVACGGLHTCCVTKDDKVFTFGVNDEGALGRKTDDEDDEHIPVEINLSLPDAKVLKVTAGDSHSALLTSDGRVFVWGCFRDSHGKLGLFRESEVWSTPKQIPLSLHFKDNVIDISSGESHILLLTEDGKVFSVGCGEQGQLGNIAEHNCDRSISGRVKPESRFLTPRRVAFGKIGGKKARGIKKVFTGTFSSFAVTTTGEVFSWGLNGHGQLGLPGKHCRFIPCLSESLSAIDINVISGGHYHTAVLSEQGDVYTLGRGDDGRLGLGKDITQIDEPTQIKELSNITAIASGDNVSYALNEQGDCFGWGFGTNCQLTNCYKDDDGEWVTNDEYSPYKLNGKQLQTRKVLMMDAGSQHVCLITKDI